MKKPCVAILMATFNGERFVAEQIKSIQEQTFTDWTLYVRDDLSTDATLPVVQNMAKKDKRIVIVSNYERGGAKKNFEALLRDVSADYYFFSDQDDIWMPKKIEMTLEKMKEVENQHPGVPVAIHTDLQVVNQELQIIAPSFWQMARIAPSLLRTAEELSAHCLITGCTLLINQKAKDVSLPFPPEAIMHDAWIALRVAVCKGFIREVNTTTMLYRQHTSNTLGAKDFRRHYVRNKIKNIMVTLRDQRRYFCMLKRAGVTVNIIKFYKAKLHYYFTYKRYLKELC